MESSQPLPSFGSRLGIAFSAFGRALSNATFAQRVAPLLETTTAPAPVTPPPAQAPTPAAPAPEKLHASGLAVLAMLQREGRLIDFLREDIGTFSDADIGAAARVVHSGSRKVLDQYFTLEPVLKENEGASVSVPPGFDAQRIRLTGNVTGQPPFRGALKHHGWVATAIRLPDLSPSLDPRVIAPAEVEL